MKSTILALVCLFFVCGTQAQTEDENIVSRIFLPSLEIGFVDHASEFLSPGVIVKTSIELRLRNNNDFFFRVNYDPYDSEYRFENIDGTSNVLSGKVLFTDILGGLGYRFGDSNFRCFLMVQPGVKLYNIPTASISDNTITIEQEGKSIFTTRTTVGFEYYFEKNAALTFDIFQSQVWEETDFWIERGGAWGFSVGVITALL